MTKTIDAIYANGVLKPILPIQGLGENDRVTVTISTLDSGHPLKGWMGGISDVDAELMRNSIDEEFERIDPDDWK